MEIQVKYNGLEDRQIKVDKQEGKGLRMLYDNFDDPNWEHGDAIIGTMTFTDVMPPVVTPEPVRDVFAEIDEIKARIGTLEKSRIA